MDGAKRGYVGHVLKMLKLSFRGTVGCFLYTTVAGESCPAQCLRMLHTQTGLVRPRKRRRAAEIKPAIRGLMVLLGGPVWLPLAKRPQLHEHGELVLVVALLLLLPASGLSSGNTASKARATITGRLHSRSA